MAVSRTASQIGLIVASAVLTSFTFKLPDWTGIRISREWPIAGAVLLMILFFIVRRREGLLTSTFAASVLGIGIGLLIAKTIRSIELGQPIRPLSIAMSVLIIGGCTWLYVTATRKERDSEAKVKAFEDELDAIKDLPPEEALEAFNKTVSEINDQVDSYLARANRTFRWAGIVLAIAMLLTILTLPLAFRPEPKPFQILLNVSILVLGTGYFVFMWQFSRIEKKITTARDEDAQIEP